MMKIQIKGDIISNDYAWIYDLFEYEYTSVPMVRAELDKAQKGEEIIVEINSGGGEIFPASEIYSMLRSYEGKVETHIVGLAASAASVIACAGTCLMSPTALMMIHNVSGGAHGDYREMNHMAEVLEEANASIRTAYTQKTGRDDSEFITLMDNETWLSYTRAHEIGLCDGLIPEYTDSNPVLINGICGNLAIGNIEEAKAKAESIKAQREADERRNRMRKQLEDFKNRSENNE